MNRFLKNLASDLFIFWPIIGFAVMGNEYAENALSFIGVLFLIIYVMSLFVVDDIAKKKIEKGEPLKAVYHKWYSIITTILETLVIASMGWYWVAAGFAIGLAVVMMVNDKHMELLNRD